MYFVVTLALKILIYASVNCGFSGFASLKLHLFIQPLFLWRNLVVSLVNLRNLGNLWIALPTFILKLLTHLTLTKFLNILTSYPPLIFD